MLILLIDDMSRYMWLQLRQTKNDAVEAIKQVQAQAEAESGGWMCVSMDGRGGGVSSPRPHSRSTATIYAYNDT
jgi:hypothetical protein